MTFREGIVIRIGTVALALALMPPAVAGAASAPIAPTATCPGQNDAAAPVATQERAMRCLVNFARHRLDIPGLAKSVPLTRAAGHKSADIIRCDSFSHEACGREFTYWMGRFGYLHGGCWQAAENIAWGSGKLGTARAIFRAWMHSAGHRENVLGPYEDLGVGLEIGELEGRAQAHVWTQEFGSHRC